MVDEARDGASSCVDNHVLVKVHEIIALSESVLIRLHRADEKTYLIVLIRGPHPPLALFLRDYLPCILNDNLIWLKAAVTANPVPTVRGFDDFDANVELAASLAALAQAAEAAVPAELLAQFAVGVIAFVEHVAVLAVFVTASLGGAHAVGHFSQLGGFPD